MILRVLSAAAVLVTLALLAWALDSSMESSGVDQRNAVNARHVVETAGPHH